MSSSLPRGYYFCASSVNNLNIPRCRLGTGQRCFAYRWVKIWSGLSKHLRTLSSLDNFKQCIFREHLSKSCNILIFIHSLYLFRLMIIILFYLFVL